MTKRNSVIWIYFLVVLMTLVLRVSSSLDVYSALGVENLDAYFTCIVQIVVFGILPIGLYCIGARRRGESFREVGTDFAFKKLSGKNFARTALLSVCMVIVAMGISVVWQIALAMMGYKRVSSPTEYPNVGALIRELVLVAVLPGFFEELTHRGLLYAGFREDRGKYVLISALLFSLMHQNIAQTGYTFVSGAAMALAVYYSGSIWAGVIMHTFNNAFSVFLDFSSQRQGGFFDVINKVYNWFFEAPERMMIGLILSLACALIMALVLWRMRRDAIKDGIIESKGFVRTQNVNVVLVLTVLIGVIATLFTLVWGIAR